MIYQHTTTRSFLKSELQRRLRNNPTYSANSFAKDLGVSKGFLSLYFSGKRKMNQKTVERLGIKLKLSSDENEYFLLLHQAETAKTAILREMIQQQMASKLQQQKITLLTLETFELMSNWHCSAIFEALLLKGIPHTSVAIAEKLKISLEQTNESLRILEKVGLVKKCGHEYERLDKNTLSTPHDIQSLALRNFHNQILRMAMTALENQSVLMRQISGMTVAIDPKQLPEAKTRIRDFIRSLANELAQGEPSEIYQISFQLFRLEGNE